MEIIYTDKLDAITAKNLAGFFEGWPNPPDPIRHLEILHSSDKVWLALDSDKCVGFINALSDGILQAYIPLLEVLPSYRGVGIGSELVRRMVKSLDGIYGIDIVCDDHAADFYRRLGFTPLVGMARRNPAYQDGSGGRQSKGGSDRCSFTR